MCFVKLYADEGITETSQKNRVEFQNMLVDAKAGAFDLIITKSVSPFARNTVDSLTLLVKGQILLTWSGTVGNCTIVTKTLDNMIFSHDLIRIDCKNVLEVSVNVYFTGTVNIDESTYLFFPPRSLTGPTP